MARKAGGRSMAAKAPPTLASIEAHHSSGNLAAAAVAIRLLHKQFPSRESLALYRRIIATQAAAAIDADDHDEFHRVIQLAESLGDDPEWLIERAILLAKNGLLPQALMTLPPDADASARQTLLEHAADRSIRRRREGSLPDEHHEAFRAIILAWQKYEQSDDESAREALTNVSLHSPFLDWKLLLRGLMAFTANDDGKALENWRRLNPARLPARLIAPLRARLDPAWRDAQPPNVVKTWSSQAQHFLGSEAQAALTDLLAVIGQPKKLKPVWPSVEKAWSILHRQHPDLAKRLEDCLYHAIMHQGHPEDMSQYRRIFGPPRDDPDFDRLQALISEENGQYLSALKFWENYERWLAKKPSGWDPAVLKRARAITLEHMAKLVVAAQNAPNLSLSGILEHILGIGESLKNHHTSADAYFEQALKTDPQALSPRLAYLQHLSSDESAHDRIIRVAREAHALAPENLEILDYLATALIASGQAADVLEIRLKALAMNPLDKNLARLAAQSCQAAVRHAFDKPTEAEKLLDTHRNLMLENDPSSESILRASLCWKTGRREEAEKHEQIARHAPNMRLAAAFLLSVDAGLVKLKMAEKKRFNQAWAEELKKPATLDECWHLHQAWGHLNSHRIQYRGGKTLEKKIQSLVKQSLEANLETSNLNHLLTILKSWRNKKFAQTTCELLLTKYPNHPRIIVALACVHSEGRRSWQLNQRIRNLLQKALRTAQSESPDDDVLQNEIREMQKVYEDPLSALFFS